MSEENKKEYYNDIFYNVVDDLLDAKIDLTQNVLGDCWLERGTFGVLIGSSGMGKSQAAVQMAIEAASGLPIFGIQTPKPLNVLVVQSEDSKNDLIKQVQCIRMLAAAPALLKRVRPNFNIIVTNRRGWNLFNWLEELYTDTDTNEVCDAPDLFILNPAFAFFDEGASVEDSKDAGYFLRGLLMPFLQKMSAAGIVVHHTPKINNRDTSKWGYNAHMYAGHGSAEWTNAPRAVMTIEATKSPKVFEFRVAKRGRQSGWDEENGVYIRHFSHAPKGTPMRWIPSTEEDIAESKQKSGLTDGDILPLFNLKEGLSLEEVIEKLKLEGFNFTTKQIEDAIGRLVTRGKLNRVGSLYVHSKFTKKSAKTDDKKTELLEIIRKAGAEGILTSDINQQATFNPLAVRQLLKELEAAELISGSISMKGSVKICRWRLRT